MEKKRKRRQAFKEKAAIILLTVLYLVISLTNLGNTKAPVNGWTPQKAGSVVYVDFEKEETIERITYLCGLGDTWYNVTALDLYYKDASGYYVYFTTLERRASTFLKWLYTDLEQPVTTDCVKVVSGIYQDKEEDYIRGTRGEIMEVCFFASDKDTPIPISSVRPTDPHKDEKSVNLFDEQDLYVYEPSYMNSTYFDEIYFPRTAYEFLIKNQTIYENTHPHLGKIIIMWSYKLFGVNPFGYRAMGAIAGALMIPVMYALGKKLFRNHYFAMIGATLLAFECMHFVQTRLGTVDSYLVLFIMLTFYFMACYVDMDLRKTSYFKTLVPLFFSGIFFGCAISVKWIGFYAGAGIAFLFFVKIFSQWKSFGYGRIVYGGKALAARNSLLTCFFCLIFFIAIPALIYSLSYTPIFQIQSAAIDNEKFTIMEMADNIIASQKHMFEYHKGVTQDHPFKSSWYTWPIMYKPVYYYSAPVKAEGQWGTIVAIGNPLIWWTGLAALIGTAIVSLRRQDRRGLFIFAGYLSILLPWAVAPRSITFLYHYFGCVPFMILAIVYMASYFMEDNPKVKKYINAYVILAILVFAAFYPAMTGIKVSVDYIELLRWLPSWWF
ncbi:MAG TPA: phospholipid carrier-dependent glycosyltransferase [Clostridia bacterium]|nr:phospholipid carrier-dependent glycosyltransferase [Clostridiaceae bacterium]HOF26566.1 phospholipid carrier-dependent glycosyltransferase [Clostridia bacterium]HOM34526.1 phospholipid carrier-dependent glycosyltransferase [Clostridia bacterium]HOR90040.1 phospholipid carrier-dependent glycosyltransferase [Clostridia bacterium]HOT70343.1 phospholipid carrier-dependent glycosyltransferase [Clostridia bacterium]